MQGKPWNNFGMLYASLLVYNLSYLKLLTRFFSLLKILQDCFICDECNDKLESSYSFKQQCMDAHSKLYPRAEPEKQNIEDFKIKEKDDEKLDADEIIDNQAQEETNEKIKNDCDPLLTEEGDVVEVVSDTDEEKSEEVFYGFEEQEDGEEHFIIAEVQSSEESDSKLTKESSDDANKKLVYRQSYTVKKKLEIIDYADQTNNRAAARFYNINESTVRNFRRQKEALLSMNPQRKSQRGANPHWPELESELKAYIINHSEEQGVKVKLKDIKKVAIEIAAKRGIQKFNCSTSYIFKFMQRNHLPSANPRPRKKRG